MTLINPLVTASTERKQETARVSLDSLHICPICTRPMRAALVAVSAGEVKTWVCIPHRIQMPQLEAEVAKVVEEKPKEKVTSNLSDFD